MLTQGLSISSKITQSVVSSKRLMSFATAPRYVALFALVCALSAAFSGVLGGSDVWAQPATPAAVKASAKKSAPGPQWENLSPSQRLALAPLATQWGGIPEAQKRKWLEVSQNFGKLSQTEITVLHSRMAEWVALTPQQRNAARINFAKTKELTPQQKNERWLAYQALSEEEKRKLAARAQPPVKTAAPAPKPAPSQKLVAAPLPKKAASKPVARLAIGPDSANTRPLLPAPAQVAPQPSPTGVDGNKSDGNK